FRRCKMSRKFMVLFVWTVVSLVIALNSGFAQKPHEPPPEPRPPAIDPITTVVADGNQITVSPRVAEVGDSTPNVLKEGMIVATLVTTAPLINKTQGTRIPAGSYTIFLFQRDGNWICRFDGGTLQNPVEIPCHLDPRVFEKLNPDEKLNVTADLNAGNNSTDVSAGVTTVCTGYFFWTACFGFH